MSRRNPTVKTTIKKYLYSTVLKDIYSENLLQIIFKASVAEFVYTSTFRRMHLKYDNYSLGGILLETLKKHPDHKSPIAKNFDGNGLKIKAKVQKATIPVVSQSDTLFGFARQFVACPIGRASKIARLIFLGLMIFGQIGLQLPISIF